MELDWKAAGAALAGQSLGRALILIETPVGDCVMYDPSSLPEFFEDPAAYHAKQLGLSKDRYLSMRAFMVDENAQCRGTTKAGRRCRTRLYYFGNKPIENFVPGIDDHCDVHRGQRLRKG